jgi:hypothetical protein
VLSVSLEVTGPVPEIEPWVKKVDSKKVLSQIDPGK